MQLSRRSRRRRKKWCGDALSFFWVWSLELSPIHPTQTSLFLKLYWTTILQDSTHSIVSIYQSVFFSGRNVGGWVSDHVCLVGPCQGSTSPSGTDCQHLPLTPLSSAIANPCFLSVMCDVMRCLPLCPLPNCQSSHRKLGAPSPLAKRISCTLHSYGRCNSDKMEN